MADLMASSANIEQCTGINVSLVINAITYCSRKLTFHRRKTQFLRNLRVLDPSGLLQRHPSDQLGQIARAGDSATASEGLELDIRDRVIIWVDPDLQLHDVAARRCAHQAGADVCVPLVHTPDITRPLVVVDDFLVVLSPLRWALLGCDGRETGSECGRWTQGPRGDGHGAAYVGASGRDCPAIHLDCVYL